MNTPCNRPEVEHVRRFVAYVKLRVDRTRWYPPVNAHRYLVALALFSKAITVAEATIVLLEAGFGDEAFGMTRTLIDIFITLHYIANEDTDERAKLYVEFFAKDSEAWAQLAEIYFPQMALTLDERTKNLAENYHHPHRWSGKSVGAMALEPSTRTKDPETGRPATNEVTYKMSFRWTSHYVHPTIVCLKNHLVQAGNDNFVVRSGKGKNMSHLALFNVAAHLSNVMIAFYYCMKDVMPSRLSNWGWALTAHLARRHQELRRRP
jgi:hypothetical protein